jgi:hypothetical protein
MYLSIVLSHAPADEFRLTSFTSFCSTVSPDLNKEQDHDKGVRARSNVYPFLSDSFSACLRAG